MTQFNLIKVIMINNNYFLNFLIPYFQNQNFKLLIVII